MGNIKTQDCDICKIHRTPSNHWFKVFIVDGGLLILEWESVGPIPDHRADSPDYSAENASAHLCGHQHVIEWISKEFFGRKTQDS